ncbi:TROVE domain-containing protein [Zooshikella harenae]|uniref:TROVE domain-containing protein n=1 Tax=Zooshikella harenae TaxID=2827238 RepID=A0ABS5Z7J0_9GAMM|nr:TROVE domain-containing protein [Zooshikella harenae]MBU2710015.1 TROVE domain-containing protein [Zooshikella harenae]
MANNTLFQNQRNCTVQVADTTNRVGGLAYQLTAEHALAQYAITGCFNNTYYVGAQEQLDKVLELETQVSPAFLAKLAIYTREKGHMKDMPALLTALLSIEAPELLPKVFNRVIDNGRMLRNFIQIIRSGVTGRQSLGTLPKRLVQQWINQRGEAALFKDSVGNTPSLSDVIKMVRPKPANKMREAFYGYLIDKPYSAEYLPQIVKDYELFKVKPTDNLPNVDFRLLTALDLNTKHWQEIARQASWQMTRMNLNTFARHDVFKNKELVHLIAERLRDERAIKKARVFPYQLMAAYYMAVDDMPNKIMDALQDAMEIALENVPVITGKVYVLPDTSGSMTQSVTGYRPGSSSKVRCIDVAALVAAAILAKNPEAEVIPFATDIHKVKLNPRDSVLTNATRLAQLGGGGTNCAAPLIAMKKKHVNADTVVYISDNESWIDTTSRYAYSSGTAVMQQWELLKRRSPNAKMVCIDVVPNSYSQAVERADILNVGGFSDNVFNVLNSFIKGEPNSWLNEINQVEL